MNRYKFSEEEVPYGILEQFGLTREMIGDLPVNVLQAIHSGRRSPILPIRVDDSEGNTIHARTRFSLVRREDGTADVLFISCWWRAAWSGSAKSRNNVSWKERRSLHRCKATVTTPCRRSTR